MKAVMEVLHRLGVHHSDLSGPAVTVGGQYFKLHSASFMRFEDSDNRWEIHDKFAPFTSLWNSYRLQHWCVCDSWAAHHSQRTLQFLAAHAPHIKEINKILQHESFWCATAYTFNGLPYTGHEGDCATTSVQRTTRCLPLAYFYCLNLAWLLQKYWHKVWQSWTYLGNNSDGIKLENLGVSEATVYTTATYQK